VPALVQPDRFEFDMLAPEEPARRWWPNGGSGGNGDSDGSGGGGAGGPSIAIYKSGSSTYTDGGLNTLAHGASGTGGLGGSGGVSGGAGTAGASANVSP
jgi:hypothetical protein